jgi:SAM-dependent methyltransferase
MKRLKKFIFPNKRVLDVGCSYGWFLETARDNNWKVKGVEPSKLVFESISQKFTGDVYNYSLNEIEKIPGTFGLITLWNVFEHLPSPANALEIIRQKLDPNGIVLICVPNSNGLITRMSFLVYRLTRGRVKNHLFRLYQLDNGYPHLFHFNRHNLQLFLDQYGFDEIGYWEQDIVDIRNIRARTESYVNGSRFANLLVSILLIILQITARFTSNDELVILAKKR